MKSRVHPTHKRNYRVRNWASYDRALVRRGDITIWLGTVKLTTIRLTDPQDDGFESCREQRMLGVVQPDSA